MRRDRHPLKDDALRDEVIEFWGLPATVLGREEAVRLAEAAVLVARLHNGDTHGASARLEAWLIRGMQEGAISTDDARWAKREL